MVTVAVDAMSGDRGAAVAMAAISDAVAKDPELKVVAVGSKEEVADRAAAMERVEFHEAAEVVRMDDKPIVTLRRRETSMYQAVALTESGATDATLSAGNTAVLMGMARIQLKMIPGFSRPALATFVPCNNCTDSYCILDLGANVDRNADMLVDFAYLGEALFRAVRGIERPTVGLLNIGEEAVKGGEDLREAVTRLSETNLNFIGNVEANRLFTKAADVVVCDGFAGNVFLKTVEGLSGMVRGMLVEAFTSNAYSKLAGLVAKPVLNTMRVTMDARRYNGAAFLGLNGLVVKSHGNADRLAFRCALDFAAKQARNDLVGMMAAARKPAP